MLNENVVFVYCQNQWLALCDGKLIAAGDDYEEVVSLALAASLF
ncbi:MAG: DUF5678 domain-containing protein [Armatimonadetes bacterium]|nr:DUF5678 domain-containing protein [Armatimonadota bacterium]